MLKTNTQLHSESAVEGLVENPNPEPSSQHHVKMGSAVEGQSKRLKPRIGPITKEWLESVVSKNQQTGCWEWLGAKGRWGYGIITYQRKTMHAHRMYYRHFVGDIPPRLCVMHKCDNVICVNPKHLSLGTNLENTWDAIAKGRMISKLSNEDVEAIKNSDEIQVVLAERFGVRQSTISRIKRLERRQNKLG